MSRKNELATLPDDMEFDAEELANAIIADEEEERARAAEDKPKKERKKRQTKTSEAIEQSIAYEQRVQLTASAFAATGSSLVEAAKLQPPFTEDHGLVLANAWVPVLDYYTGESSNPTVPALITTGIVLMPYFFQLMQRSAEAKKAATEAPDSVES